MVEQIEHYGQQAVIQDPAARWHERKEGHFPHSRHQHRFLTRFRFCGMPGIPCGRTMEKRTKERVPDVFQGVLRTKRALRTSDIIRRGPLEQGFEGGRSHGMKRLLQMEIRRNGLRIP